MSKTCKTVALKSKRKPSRRTSTKKKVGLARNQPLNGWGDVSPVEARSESKSANAQSRPRLKQMEESLETQRLVFREMTPSTQEVAKKLHAKMNAANLRDLLAKHAIGTMLYMTTSRPFVYGPDALRQFAMYTGIDGGEKTLLDLRCFAQSFTQQFIRQQANIPLANGAFLTYRHFVALMKVPSLDERNQLLARFRAEGLTVAQWRREVANTRRRQHLPLDEGRADQQPVGGCKSAGNRLRVRVSAGGSYAMPEASEPDDTETRRHGKRSGKKSDH